MPDDIEGGHNNWSDEFNEFNDLIIHSEVTGHVRLEVNTISSSQFLTLLLSVITECNVMLEVTTGHWPRDHQSHSHYHIRSQLEILLTFLPSVLSSRDKPSSRSNNGQNPCHFTIIVPGSMLDVKYLKGLASL